jgi:hypothetical protein
MELPEILQAESGKRLFQGAVIGALATMLVGFYWGGWKLGSTATEMSRVSAMEAKVNALAPICVDRFKQASTAQENLIGLKKESSWRQGEFVEKGGWATFGGASPDTSVARACADLLSSMKS